MELVGRRHKALSRQGGDLLRDLLRKALGRVQARADCRAAQGQLAERPHGQADQLDVPLQGGPPAADLLGKADRDRVLQVGPAALDDPLIFFLQLPEDPDQALRRGDQPVLQGRHRRNVHGRRKSVVGGLTHIDVIIGMAELLPGNLIGPVRDDLVGIHIGLGPRPGLPHDQGEMVIQKPPDHLVRRRADGIELLHRHFFRLQGMIGPGRGFFQVSKGPDDLPGHGLDPDPDREVPPAPLRLRRPVPVRRHPDFSHRIMLNAIFHSNSPRFFSFL